ncbi:MAG: hypothetical protein PF444_00645, partial [Bacteroidales bacterium]|nr:hypothetical protein [Bacteroidales bacterium]
GNVFEILNGATFATGAFDHTVGGHFDVGGHLATAGTFIPADGTSITLNGTGVQNIYGGTLINFENLVVNNSAGVDLIADIVVNKDLTLVSGNLNVGATTLLINSGITKTAGFINTSVSSSLTFGGTSALSLASNLFYTTPSIDTLTINRSGGVVWGSDLTVNGEVNLQSANPVSGIIGSLDMGVNTLNMGATATTVGAGDVTGKVKRSTILPNVKYTFGHQNSSIIFANVGTLPTEITLKISIGEAPSWKTDGINRIYDISQIGGSETRSTLKTHYLDNELNGNKEISLSYFGYIIPSATLLDRGLSEINTAEDWILLNNVNFSNLPPVLGVIEHALGVSTSNVMTWNGSVSTDWNNASNWTPVFSPDSTKIVIIPHADSTDYDPLLAANDSVSTLSIHTGGILNAAANTELTIFGAGGAWLNNGTFNASTSSVIFDHGELLDNVTVAGTTDFYNIQIGANTTFVPVPGATFRIAGAVTGAPTSHADWSATNCTVEWNGVNQNINNPQGIGGNSGYYNLILSGSGSKTMPASALTIRGDFSIAGTATAVAADSIDVIGNTTIENGATFESGGYTHLLQGNFENNGTFTALSGGNMTFNGTSTQIISGSSTDFDNLSIDNILGVTQETDINVNNTLTLTDGFLSVGANTLSINGSISHLSAYIGLSSSSNLSFGGTDALYLNDNLFNADPTISNLIINRTGGVSLGNEDISVSDSLALTAGTLTVGENTLTIAASHITRSSGYIDASNAAATLVFANASAMTLPPSLFDGNVNNMTVSGAGGITSGSDITLNHILHLQSANPSSTKGSLDMGTDTLYMEANATTTGIGDVTGILKREHTFGNGIDYSFGNQYTTLNFLNVLGSTKPTWISCKIEIGVAPAWRSEAINRSYSFAQSGGTDRMIVKLHYLDSELHGAE